MRCPLSTSPRRICPFHRYLSGYRCVARSLPLRRASALSTAICTATGALPVLYLSDTHLPFPATGALPALYLSNACLSFHRHLSCYTFIVRALLLRRAFLLSTTRLQVRCLLSTTDAHLPFPPLSVELQLPWTLSTSLTRISPFHRWLSDNRPSTSFRSTTPFPTAGFPVRGSFSPLHLMFISLLTPFPKRVPLKHVQLQRRK